MRCLVSFQHRREFCVEEKTEDFILGRLYAKLSCLLLPISLVWCDCVHLLFWYSDPPPCSGHKGLSIKCSKPKLVADIQPSSIGDPVPSGQDGRVGGVDYQVLHITPSQICATNVVLEHTCMHKLCGEAVHQKLLGSSFIPRPPSFLLLFSLCLVY